ncbi:PIN domain-containing protein [Candidatus Pacearchaeota archaeon]|nr:PIN domain-containing protein [Candidatus Pacearchaeota archaeon]
MSYEYVIDSYAWVEYFRGSEKGAKAKEFIESGKAATSSVTIAELSEKYERESKEFEEDFNFIILQTKIVNLDMGLARKSGKINFENKKIIKNWGMADSIILAAANLFGARVVTGDEHFRNLNSIMI